MSRASWPGLIPAVRRFFFGEAKPPKAKRFGETTTPTTSSYYEGMPEDYRWFRQDELVRKCMVTNAYFATMTAGFETVLEPTSEDIDVEDYAFLKEGIDELEQASEHGPRPLHRPGQEKHIQALQDAQGGGLRLQVRRGDEEVSGGLTRWVASTPNKI